MTTRFEGKVAVVCGAAQGIGAATARRLAADGARTIVMDINGDGARSVAQGIVEAGGAAWAVQADLRDEASLKAMFDDAAAAHGGVDLLVNNAFLGSPEDLDVVSTPMEVWARIYDVNIMGYVRSCRHAIPLMIARGGGAIVNVSSGAALYAERRRSAYGTSKAAVAALVRNIAVQFGPQNIRANAVAPGTVASETVMRNIGGDPALINALTSRTPLGRLGRPEELAAVICFLLSDDASFLTGQILSVDGGRLAAGPGVADAIPTMRGDG